MSSRIDWRRNRRNTACFAAHAFVDGRPLCTMVGTGSVPVDHVAVPLTQHGVPYGKVCAVCVARAKRVEAA
jgi:hypothetical protein